MLNATIHPPTDQARSCAGRRCSRIEPLLAPRFARGVAPEYDPLMQSERAVVPELHLDGRDAEARPEGWAGDFADRIAGGHAGNCLLQREPALQGTRLLRGPGAEPAAAGARGEIGVGLGVAGSRDDRRARAPAGAAISNGSTERLSARPAVPRPWRFRGWYRRRSRARGGRPIDPFSSTMRTLGMPAASTLASAIALGSLGSCAWASANQASNSANGSPASAKSPACGAV